MWDSWYFLRFLLRDGSLNQMYIASLMVLVTTCDSLPTMVKHSSLSGCPLVWIWQCIGDRALSCSFNLSPNDLSDSPYIPPGNYCYYDEKYFPSNIVPYTKGLSERFKKTCNSLGIQMHFIGNITI